MRTPRVHAKSILLATLPLLFIATLAGCGDDDDAGETSDVAAFSLEERLLRIEIPVTQWGRAEDLAEVQASAEAAANLVVGSEGPGYGDLDGDGVVEDEDVDEFGVLPGIDGTTPGLAELVDNECVEADVLGGSWDDPAARWAELDAAVEAWSPENDTIAALASQPMQIVAWARLATSTDAVDEAREFGDLAASNLDISLDAVDC